MDKEKKGSGKNHLELTPKEWLFFLSSETAQRASDISRLIAKFAILIAVFSLGFNLFQRVSDKPLWVVVVGVVLLIVIVCILIFLGYMMSAEKKAESEKKCMDKIKKDILDGKLYVSDEIYERWKDCLEPLTRC